MDWSPDPKPFEHVVVGPEPQKKWRLSDEPTCEFVLAVPPWRPSPDGAEKLRLARELLDEFRSFGYTDARKILIRDFNINDPDILAYIVNNEGDIEFQGCNFSRETKPHCGWHMFGQSPLASVKKDIMAYPYRLFPLPIGPVKRPAARSSPHTK